MNKFNTNYFIRTIVTKNSYLNEHIQHKLMYKNNSYEEQLLKWTHSTQTNIYMYI